MKSRSIELLFNRALVFKVTMFSSNNCSVDDSCTFRYKMNDLLNVS